MSTTVHRFHKIANFDDTTACSSTTTGAVVIAGGLGLAGGLCMGGSLDTTSVTAANVYGSSTGGEDLTLSGNSSDALGSVLVTGTTDSTSKDTGALIVTDGGMGIELALNVGTTGSFGTSVTAPTYYGSSTGGGNMTLAANSVNTAGSITISTTTSSTNKDTGALVVEGGVGIEENLNVGGNANVTGTFDVTGATNFNATTSSTTPTTGAVIIDGGLGVAENVNAGGWVQGDNIRIGGVGTTNTIASTDTDGDISILPNGTGEVLLKADPTSNLGAATKQYVDATASGLDIKNSVRVKTFAALPAYTQSGSGVGATLTADANGAFPTVDGVTLVQNDRILVDTSGSASDVDNGIYDLTTVGDGSTQWVLTRSTDFDNSPSNEVTSGAFTFVEEGTSGTGNGYVVTTANPITLDTTAIVWAQFSGAGTITASNQGAGGIGVFDVKIGNDLQFRNINAGDNTIGVSLDAGNKEVDIIVNQANLDHGTIGGLADDDHTQYALLAGRSGGQALIGSTLTTEGITIRANSADLTTGALQILTTVQSTSSTTGAFIVDGGVGIAKNLHVGGTFDVTGAANFNDTTASTSTTTGAVIVDGGAGIAGAVNAGGAIETTDSTASTSSTTGSLIAAGGLGVAGAVFVGSATNSTTIDTGALVLENGGLGVELNITSGGRIQTTDTTASSSTTTGSLIAGGGLGVAADIYLGGDIVNSTTGGMSITGGSGASDDLTLTSTSNGTKGEIIIQDNLDHQGEIAKWGPTGTHSGTITSSHTTAETGWEEVLTFTLNNGSSNDQYLYAEVHLTSWTGSAFEVFSAIVVANNNAGTGAVTEEDFIEFISNSNFRTTVNPTGGSDNKYAIEYNNGGASGKVIRGWARYVVNGPQTGDLTAISMP